MLKAGAEDPACRRPSRSIPASHTRSRSPCPRASTSTTWWRPFPTAAANWSPTRPSAFSRSRRRSRSPRPAAPADIKTNEELYLIGLRAEQFHDPNLSIRMPYWQEALRRDPGDVRVNTVLGIGSYRKARYAGGGAATCAPRSTALTDRYTAPKDGEAFYYLGAALKAAGQERRGLHCSSTKPPGARRGRPPATTRWRRSPRRAATWRPPSISSTARSIPTP